MVPLSVGKPRMNLGTRTPARLSVKKVVVITAIWRDYVIYVLLFGIGLKVENTASCYHRVHEPD